MKKLIITALVLLAVILALTACEPRYSIRYDPGDLRPYEVWLNAETDYKRRVKYDEMMPEEQREIDWECATAQLNVLHEIADTFDPLNMDITYGDSATDWFDTLNSQFSYSDPAQYSRSYHQLAINRFPETLAEVKKLAARAAETIISRAITVAEGYAEKGDYHSAYIWYAYIERMFPPQVVTTIDYIPEEEQMKHQQRKEELLRQMPEVPCLFIEWEKRQDTFKKTYSDWYFVENGSETIRMMQSALDGGDSLMEYALEATLYIDGWYGEVCSFYSKQQFSTFSFSFKDYHTLEYYGVYGRSEGEEKNRELIPLKVEHDEEAEMITVEYDVRDIDEIRISSHNPGVAYAPYSQVVGLTNMVYHW